eukprot:1676382-Ditylum_brightwellii.AAC.1
MLLGLFFGCNQEKGHQCRKPEVQRWHLWHHFEWEGSGGVVAGAMVQQKDESWGLTGSTHF